MELSGPKRQFATCFAFVNSGQLSILTDILDFKSQSLNVLSSEQVNALCESFLLISIARIAFL